eukprot:ANDGO_03885.mRNA.1 GyrI-like small molecule-binding domain protein
MRFWTSVLVAALAVTAYVVVDHGVFQHVHVWEAPFDSFEMILAKHRGPYHHIGPVIESVFSIVANATHIPKDTLARDADGAGVFLDDPMAVADSSLLRSLGGLVLPKNGAKISEEQWVAMQKLAQDQGGRTLERISVRKQQYVQSYFPLRSRILSFMIAPFKVYPAIEAFIFGKNADKPGHFALSIEIYKPNSILYLIPTSEQDDDAVYKRSEFPSAAPAQNAK